MLVDLLCSGNLVSFNSRIAQMIGLHPAIYLAELLTIEDKATRKNKKDGDYFILDRKYIEDRTTLDEKEQLDIEEKLVSLGILYKGEDSSSMTLDVNTLTSLFMTDDDKLIKKVQIVAKRGQKRETKQEGAIRGFQDHLVCENEELRQAYCDWIESAMKKNGYLTKAIIQAAQDTIDEFSQRDLDVALEVIKIATINGYRDMSWAIERYVKSGKPIPKKEKKTK